MWKIIFHSGPRVLLSVIRDILSVFPERFKRIEDSGEEHPISFKDAALVTWTG
ncbi:MAG: hypothetical protein ACRECH_03930 [Nitrososphaerales archaeon]